MHDESGIPTLPGEVAMSLIDVLRAKLLEARKARSEAQKNVLTVVLGDISTFEANHGKAPADEEVEKTIRKLILANTETMGHKEKRGDDVTTLKEETAFLESLLPKTLSVAEIKEQLADVLPAIRSAKNDGQATGAAMKHLKGKNLKVLGDVVAAAVKELRQ
jgi:uncharacterized protein YqeY